MIKMMKNKIYQGNSLDVLKTFPEKSIDMAVTSPPYWGLRDYQGEDTVWDCDCEHEHDFSVKAPPRRNRSVDDIKNPDTVSKIQAGNTGSVIDLTETAFCSKCHCEHEWHEADKKIKYGGGFPRKEVAVPFESSSNFCSKCNAWKGSLGLEPNFDLYIKHLCDIFEETKRVLKDEGTLWVNLGDTYDKNKSLLGIPFRFAIEMISRGWILRNTLIWHKNNVMPSSVKDRFTVDFEYLFFFSKQQKYYFEQQKEVNGRNKRTTFFVNPKPYSESHFAVYPEELIETPIKAGCPENGTVLDMFMGSGTTALVALKNNRNYVGIELNPEYIKIAEKRLSPYQNQKLDNLIRGY